MRTLTCSALAVAALTGAGCGSSDDEKTKAEAPAATTKAPEGSATTAAENAPATTASRRGRALSTHSSQFGRILSDGRGRALYIFTREKTKKSRCYGDCAVAWPPFLTKGKPRAAGGTRSKLLGTTRRRNGKLQVTYRGKPLYYYVTDTKPGQVTCQDVDEFGGTWLVADKNGRAIR